MRTTPHHWKNVLLCILSWSFMTICHPQSSISSGGESVKYGHNGEVSYTIGLTNYQSSQQKQGSISAGMQHAQIVQADADITKEGLIYQKGALNISVGPNPTRNSIIVKINTDDTFPFVLTNLAGRTIEQGTLRNASSLSLAHLPQGEYLLKIENKKESHSIIVFKLVKL